MTDAALELVIDTGAASADAESTVYDSDTTAVEASQDAEAGGFTADDDDDGDDSGSAADDDDDDHEHAAAVHAALHSPTLLFHFAVAPHSAAARREAMKRRAQAHSGETAVRDEREAQTSWLERWEAWRNTPGNAFAGSADAAATSAAIAAPAANLGFGDELDTRVAASLRRLDKPVGALEPARLRAFVQRADALAELEQAQNSSAAHFGAPAATATGDEGKGEGSMGEESCGDGGSSGAHRRYLYGTHYSSSASVLFFLLRMEPFTSLARLQAASSGGGGGGGSVASGAPARPQRRRGRSGGARRRRAGGGRLQHLRECGHDHADRLLHSVGSAWANALTSHTDVKELVPEMFCVPECLEWAPHWSNALDAAAEQRGRSPRHAGASSGVATGNGCDRGLGVRQDGAALGAVRLPRWAFDDGGERTSSTGDDQRTGEDTSLARLRAHGFVRQHREALESELVSVQLARWIDLVFGIGQRGGAARRADNLFHPLSYEGAVELGAVGDALLREASRVQVAFFGQAPRVLFARAHPRRMLQREAAGAGWGWPATGPLVAGEGALAIAPAAAVVTPAPPAQSAGARAGASARAAAKAAAKLMLSKASAATAAADAAAASNVPVVTTAVADLTEQLRAAVFHTPPARHGDAASGAGLGTAAAPAAEGEASAAAAAGARGDGWLGTTMWSSIGLRRVGNALGLDSLASADDVTGEPLADSEHGWSFGDPASPDRRAGRGTESTQGMAEASDG
eukprot:g4954.t1